MSCPPLSLKSNQTVFLGTETGPQVGFWYAFDDKTRPFVGEALMLLVMPAFISGMAQGFHAGVSSGLSNSSFDGRSRSTRK